MDEILDTTLDLNKKWKHWHYKNTALLILSIVTFFYLAETPQIKNTIEFIGGFGYIGAFIAGALFVSIFTVAPASIALFYLAETLDPVGIAVAAGAGSVVGDYLIFRFLKDKIYEELRPFFMGHGGKPLQKLFKTPYFAWSLPLIGAFIIASPLPDEVGLGMLGLTKIKVWQLMGVLFLLNAVGIFLIVTAARAF